MQTSKVANTVVDVTDAIAQHNHDDRYNEFVAALQANFEAALKFGGALFKTDADVDFEVFLDALPHSRQYYNCHCCRQFVNRYGGLVAIDDKGRAHPALWDDLSAIPPFYLEAATKMCRAVVISSVTGVFYNREKVLGTPFTNPWSHMAVKSPIVLRPSSLVKNAGQQMAEKAEEFKMMKTALTDFKVAHIERALEMAKTDALFRAEKVEGVLQWFMNTWEEYRTTTGVNRLWKEVATAPVGYAHIRGGVAGTILEDIKAGKSDAAIKAAFAKKMDPLQYQRPQAAPKSGNIAAADDIIEKMGIANSLKRRFATEEDILAWVWRPKWIGAKGVGSAHFGDVADSVRKVGSGKHPSPATNGGNITWTKFQRDILPLVDAMWMYTGSGNSPYTGLLTATDASAPPILQWDFEEARNPVSWYLYHYGSQPREWNLQVNQYVTVTGICLPPALWTGRYKGDSYKQTVLAILKGAYDTKIAASGEICLFPEILKSDLHSVRATIERASKIRHLDGEDEAQAAGIRIGGSQAIGIAVQLRSGSQVGYTIDRWE